MTATARRLLIGDHAPDFHLSGPDGQTYSLASFHDQPFLVIIFSSNHCPYVAAWEDRVVAIGQEFGSRGVAFLAVSAGDSAAETQQRAAEKGYPFPYLADQDQAMARAYGATRTPEVFAFDRNRTLRYHGAVDSDFEESSGMENYLRDALHTLLNAQQVMQSETPLVGCTIKYREGA